MSDGVALSWPARLLRQASYHATPLWSSVPFGRVVVLGLPLFPSVGPFVTFDLEAVSSSEQTLNLFGHLVFTLSGALVGLFFFLRSSSYVQASGLLPYLGGEA